MNADLSYWDRQFKFSSVLPDFADCLAEMEQSSASVSDRASLTRLDYGSDARQWVEYAEGEGGDLIAVFIHGGYWRALRAEDHRFVLPGLRAIAPFVANVEYRLIPSVRMEGVVADVVLGLKALIKRLGSDRKLFLIGHSAGAHLAMAAARSSELSGHIAAIAALSGIYKLQPVTWSFLQAELTLSDEEVMQWSVHADACAVPTILCVGEDETNEFHRQAQVRSSHSGASVFDVPGVHHMTILNALADSESLLTGELRTWLSDIKEQSKM